MLHSRGVRLRAHDKANLYDIMSEHDEEVLEEDEETDTAPEGTTHPDDEAPSFDKDEMDGFNTGEDDADQM